MSIPVSTKMNIHPLTRMAPLVPLLLFLWFLSAIPAVARGEFWKFSASWAPSLGTSLSFRVDGLALLFALLITGVGVLVTVYSNWYMAGKPGLGRFQIFLLLFMGSMLGLTTADNSILLFVFWELTSFTSFLLIGFDSHRREAREAALKALLVTSGGGLVLLGGLVMLGIAGGSFEISELGNLAAHPLYLPILITIAIGCFTKSAQVPFHFWLPAAMEAPSPVSAYLHSATMVKAGVFLLARLAPTLGGTEAWFTTLTWIGALTMVTGGFMAIRARDLKQILAHSTVAALGMLVLLLGVDTPEATRAAMVLLFAHALYKASLFLVAGGIDHDVGTRNVRRLGGLAGAMPLAAITAGIGAMGLAGVGPVLAFIAKEMLFEALLLKAGAAWLLVAAFIAAGGMLTAAALVVGYRIFWAGELPPGEKIHESRALILPPLLLGIISVLFAVVPSWTSHLLTPAVAAVTGRAQVLELHLWHGIGAPLLFSGLTLLLGAAVYTILSRADLGIATERLVRWGPDAWYAASVKGLLEGSERITRLLQSGHLRSYILIILITAIGLIGSILAGERVIPEISRWDEPRLHEVMISILILAAAIAAIRSESRLGAVASLGVVGYGVALIYIAFSAPDLAMTQFLIETLMVILLVLVIYHLPRFVRISTPGTRLLDAVVSLGVGAIMTTFVLVATGEPVAPEAARFYAETSYREGYGRNIVNVILVDFRALDTAGEITVLAIAAVGVYALLKLRIEEKTG